VVEQSRQKSSWPKSHDPKIGFKAKSFEHQHLLNIRRRRRRRRLPKRNKEDLQGCEHEQIHLLLR